MTTYSKPAVRSAWGQTASGSDLVDPGNTFASAGWQIGVKPPRQYMNWVLNYAFAGIRYLCQQGIANWDAAESYAANALVISPGGYLYRCIASNSGQNPEQPSIPSTYWDAPQIGTAPTGDNSNRIANTAFVANGFLRVGTAVGSLPGQVTNAQVPVGAVTQWQGSLSIGGSQVTSAVARANTLLINGYATFNWSGQSGQPTWLFGSNDGTNIFVWNPANFSVANAATLAGIPPSIPAAGSSIVQRDGNGYTYSAYFNQSSPNNENGAISQIMITNGGDNFLRKASVAAVKVALGALAVADFPASKAVPGYQKLPSGVIIQWGEATISGTTTVTFPIAFPSNAASVVFTNINSTNQMFLNGAPLGNTGFSVTNGSAVISWLAVGY